jgi:pyruvate/2-oxoglutarate/acetoin dehydrogenase E1 component
MALDEGIEVEIIDLRSLDEASFDRTTIAPSIEKTGAVVIVEDASWNQGVGVQISERISRELFDLLDFPVQRVAGKNVPTPVSRPLEEFVLLNDDDVRTALRSAARRIRD